MKTLTFGEVSLSKGHDVVSADNDTKEVSVCFTSSDYLQNGACISMTPFEAKKLAMKLIVFANKLEPIE